MSTQPLTFKQYLEGLPDDRRREVERVWRAVRKSAPRGYAEEVGPKFLALKAGDEPYVMLANQKNYISLYLMPVYVFPELKARLDAAAPGLKCGKSCVTFKRADELPLDVIGEIVAATDAESYRATCARTRGRKRK